MKRRRPEQLFASRAFLHLVSEILQYLFHPMMVMSLLTILGAIFFMVLLIEQIL